MADTDKLGRPYFELLDGSIQVWIEQEAIHIKAVERRHPDPVELTGAMARQLAAALLDMAERIGE